LCYFIKVKSKICGIVTNAGYLKQLPYSFQILSLLWGSGEKLYFDNEWFTVKINLVSQWPLFCLLLLHPKLEEPVLQHGRDHGGKDLAFPDSHQGRQLLISTHVVFSSFHLLMQCVVFGLLNGCDSTYVLL